MEWNQNKKQNKQTQNPNQTETKISITRNLLPKLLFQAKLCKLSKFTEKSSQPESWLKKPGTTKDFVGKTKGKRPSGSWNIVF